MCPYEAPVVIQSLNHVQLSSSMGCAPRTGPKTHGISFIWGDGAAAVPRCPACSLDTLPSPHWDSSLSPLVGEESLFCGSAAYFLGDEMFSSWIYSSLLISVLTNPSLKILRPASATAGRKCKMVQLLWKTVEIPQKSKIEWLYELQYHIWVYIWKKMKLGSRWDICTPMFIAVLFTIPKRWKQPNHPWVVEWIKKMWYIHTVECYSALKKGNAPICDNMDDPVGHYA